MPYYQGDYYAGDPGFFSFIGKAAKGLGKLALGAAGVQLPGKATKALPAAVAAPAAAGAAATGIVRKVSHIIVKHPVLSAAGAAGTVGGLAAAGIGAGSMVASKMAPGAAPALPVGAKMRVPHLRVPGMRHHKRMNPCNIHALRRAVRRAQSFSRIAKKVLRFTSPRPPRGRAVFKHRKRAKRI